MYDTLLFLDFDGTYWPRSSANPRYFKEFAQFVLEHPGLGVVISSNWRFTHDLADLQGYFHPQIESRVFATLDLEDDTAPGVRQSLIERFVHRYQAGREQAGLLTMVRFVALDDNAALFTPNWNRLILCEYSEGLNKAVMQAVHQRLVSEFASAG